MISEAGGLTRFPMARPRPAIRFQRSAWQSPHRRITRSSNPQSDSLRYNIWCKMRNSQSLGSGVWGLADQSPNHLWSKIRARRHGDLWRGVAPVRQIARCLGSRATRPCKAGDGIAGRSCAHAALRPARELVGEDDDDLPLRQVRQQPQARRPRPRARIACRRHADCSGPARLLAASSADHAAYHAFLRRTGLTHLIAAARNCRSPAACDAEGQYQMWPAERSAI